MNKENIYRRKIEDDEVIPLSYDREFKLVFGDSNHLERLNLLLSSLLKRKVEVLELLPTELLDDNRLNKKNEMDLFCRLDNEYVSIEVNLELDKTVIDRNIAFISRALSKELKVGDEYKKISRYYQININLVDTLGKHFEVCHLKGNYSNKMLTDLFEIYYINVSYYAKLCYDNNGKDLTDLEKILGAIGTNKKSVIDTLSKDNDILKDIGDTVKKYSEDDNMWFYYDRDARLKEDMRRIYSNEFDKKYAKEYEEKYKRKIKDFKKNVTKEVTDKVTKELTDKVTKEVTDKVTKNTTLELAKKMKTKCMKIDDIASVTGLSSTDIERL